MREKKEIEISGKKVVVSEMTLRQIFAIKEKGQKILERPEIEHSKFLINEIFKDCIVGVTTEELIDFAPSELKGLCDAFREVNTVFLEMLVKTGILKTVKNFMKTEFQKVQEVLIKEIEKEATEN
ncbi:hypothetical protein DRH14_03970 [Candidatus Shapirobacteria bacterium]|nr:MAG: hypothetical protein DRH14_03970 [Candidatus Shapirobacteria bacterium]